MVLPCHLILDSQRDLDQSFTKRLFTRLLTGLFTLLWRYFIDVLLSLFLLIPYFSLAGNVVSMRYKNYGILKNTDNIDLKITPCVFVHSKMLSYKFRILNSKNSGVIHP